MNDPFPPDTPVLAPRRFRLTMGTMMIGVVTAAVASALFAELWRLIKMPQVAYLNVDVPAVVLLGISLNAVAAGCWFKLTIEQVLVQVAICCLLFLVGAWMWEAKYQRGLRYWLQLSFAIAVVAPLLVRRLLADRSDLTPWNRWLLSNLKHLWFAYANFIVMLIVLIFQFLILLLLNGP